MQPGTPSPRLTALAVAAVIVLAPGLGRPAPAAASHPDGLPNWPELAPPSPTATGKLKLAFEACRAGAIRCPRHVIRRMYRRWRPLDRRCDHRAVFALTYLRTTEEFERTISKDKDFFSGRHWVNQEDTVFAELYFRAFDRWDKDRSVPAAWRIAFEAAKSDDVTGPGDLLLGMNAHINRDLPYTLAHVGLTRPNGESRKPDHDKVNEFLERVVDPVQKELARRYDPMFEATDGGPSPLEEIGMLQIVREWREQAWRNAERLIEARDDPAQLAAVRESIEHQAEAEALTILAGNTVPGYGETRDEHCREASRSKRSKDDDRRGDEEDEQAAGENDPVEDVVDQLPLPL